VKLKEVHAMEQTPNTHTHRGFAIGFFGWFVIGNLALWLEIVADSKNIKVPFFVLIPVTTVLVIGILFIMKRNRFAYGILMAVITNTVIIAALGAGRSPTAEKLLDLLLVGISSPLPLGLVTLMQ
jgi:hypothetical protein